MAKALLAVGEPAPWFIGVSTSNPKYHFDSVAGRYVVLGFFESASSVLSQRLLQSILRYREYFDDETCCFFGVTTDPTDQGRSHLQEQLPGIRFFWDFDRAISQQFGVIGESGDYHSCLVLLDERLRILATIPVEEDSDAPIKELITVLNQLPPIPTGTALIQAPILVVPRIFEPSLCQALINYYNQNGGEESGFMREIKGQTVYVSDPGFKRRRDQEILDTQLRNAAMFRIHDRLVPEIQKAFQFDATRIERHIVACYDSAFKGFFRPHRDNTTKGTAHRRFAVSLNLNTGEYEGGFLRFPEFGRQTYTAPAGGAVVFSCALLHEATPVTQGVRYAYLPFLYDDQAAKIRQQNQQFIGESKENSLEYELQEKSVPTKPKGFQTQSMKSKRK